MSEGNELKALLKDIGKEFVTTGKEIPEPDYYSSGILRVDKLLGGGWPSGRTITMFGRDGAGKSTLALSSVADAQRQGKTALWIDCEHSFSAPWASIMGVDIDNLIVVQNRSLEHILAVMQKLYEKKEEIDVIVIDSISAVQTMKFFDDDNHQIGSQARATKEFLAKSRFWFPHSLMICLSQITQAPVGGMMWGDIPTGGKALKHESSYIVKLSFGKVDMKKEKVKVGNREIESPTVTYVDVTWVMEKARSANLGARGTYRLRPGVGIDKLFELLVEAVHSGVMERGSRGHFRYKDELWHGEANVLEALKENETLREEVYKDVLGRDEQFEQIEPDGDSGSEGD